MKALLYCLAVFLLFSACKKESDNLKPVLAGVYDDTMAYTELNPVLEIALRHDTLLNVDYGEDSLDLDKDGSFDIIFSQRIPLDRNYDKNTTIDTYPFYKLSLKNGLEVAYKEDYYYTGHGQTTSIQWIDTIAYKENVRDITFWSESNIYRFLWVDPPTIFWGSNGPWYNLVNEEKYGVFRMNINFRYRYGWIRIKETSREKIAIISYAMEK